MNPRQAVAIIGTGATAVQCVPTSARPRSFSYSNATLFNQRLNNQPTDPKWLERKNPAGNTSG